MSSDDPTITDETQREFEALAGLLRSAGRRIDPPEAARQQAFAVALEAWREKSAHCPAQAQRSLAGRRLGHRRRRHRHSF